MGNKHRLIVCPACGSHAKPTETACPHCGAALGSSGGGLAPAAVLMAMGLVAVTCGDEAGDDDTRSTAVSVGAAAYTVAVSNTPASSSTGGDGGAGAAVGGAGGAAGQNAGGIGGSGGN